MLEVKNLSYPPILATINLTFKPGFIHGILGPNGSGKTTLLKLMKKIWTPAQGEIFWHGQPLHRKPLETISQVMTLVPQNPQISFGFPLKEFVEMGCYPKANCPKSLLKKILKLMDLEHLATHPITELSGGEKQRAYIARSLITDAPVILLDEPTANLDIKHQQMIWASLESLAQKGKTLITATHDLAAAQKYCHTLALFSQGRCLNQSTFDEVLTNRNLLNVFGVRTYS